MKRMVSLSLAVCLLAASLPLPVYAEEPPAPAVDNQVTVEGTNDFGELLGDSLEEAQEEQAEEAVVGYGVTDLTFDGATATVSYETLEPANLVVGVYTEDGSQLLASGSTVVQPEGGTAAVTIEGEMPTYFLAKAFLVDTYDFSPLSSEYATPLYTREMQELLASTADDYAADRVLTLGEDRTTNFAVYAEGTRRIQAAEGANLLTDNGNGTYTVANADESFTTLAVGDVFSYEYADGDLLIAKVAAVEVDGTTVTITEDENVEMSDVFSQVKIEAQAGTDDLQYSPEGADEAIEYLGTGSGQSGLASTMSARSEEDVEIELKLGEKKFTNEEGETVTITGLVGFTMDFDLDYYITLNQFYVEFTDKMELDAGVEIKGKMETAIPLGYFFLTPVPSVKIGFTPSLVVETTGTIKNTIHSETTVGFSYHTDSGFTNRCVAPTLELLHYDVNGTLFVGLDFKPDISIISAKVFSVKVDLETGAKVKGTMIGAAFAAEKDETHACQKCVEGKVDLIFRIEPTFTFLNKKLDLKIKAFNQEGRLLDFYYSVDHNEFGVGICPYRTFLVCMTTYGMDDRVAPGVTLALSNDTKTTNDNGVAEFWLPGGGYTVYATWPGGHSRTQDVTVSEACNVAIPYFEPPAEARGVFGSINVNAIADRGELIDQGIIWNAGVEVGRWQLWGDRTLIVSVSGSMDVRPAFSYPWAKYIGIRQIILTGGVTAVGAVSSDNEYLEEVDIPEGVRVLYGSFTGSPNLKQVELPSTLREITWAFQKTGLTSVVIPENVTKLSGAFTYCENLKEVKILGPVESLGGSFAGCSALEELIVPSTVLRITNGEFANCTSLKNVTLPEGLETILGNAFENCTSLESIIIPSSVKSIESSAFMGCTSLKTIQFTGDMPEIGDLTNESNTITALYPKDNPTWTEEKLYEAQKYNSSITWLWYDYDENGEMIVEVPGKDVVGEGIFGNNLTWVLQEDGTLTISGSGEMPDFNANDENDRPWGQAGKFGIRSVKKVVVESGVTNIGAYAFYGTSNLESVEMADTVISISNDAFGFCEALDSVTWPQNLQSIGNYAFSNCSALQTLDLPESMQIIGNGAFTGCRGIKEVVLPEKISVVGSSAFRSCSNLVKVDLPDAVTVLESYTFEFCPNLESIILPRNLNLIMFDVVNENCTKLQALIFTGDVPTINYSAFLDVPYDQLVYYYPADNETWTETEINYFSNRCIPYTLDENGNMVIMEQEQVQSAPAPEATALPEATPAPESTEAPAGTPEPETAGPESLLPPASPETARSVHAAPAPEADGETADPQGEGYDRILDEETVSLPSTLAAVGGEYGTTETGARTASFTGLRPGGSYVLLALASVETETPLSANNLLYITQGIADDSGNLQFTYRPQREVDTSYVVACGPSTKDLADAEITLPAMYANGAEQTVRPTIVYDGETLTEGTDYVLVGQVSATDPGDYQCQVRGIYNYTGLVTIQYTVSDRPPEITSPTYEIADGCLYLPAATTAETLLTELTGADIRITSAGGEALAGKDPVGTGATLAQGEGEAELVVVLGGDIDGNGQIDTSDLLEMRRSLLEMIELEGAPLQAATVVSGADQPNTSDLLQLRRVLVGLADSMFPTPVPEPPAEGSAA